ncbi:hypothetical protein KC887_06525 [Candidatus Kaiserbacteria bacterium]|nr:hypothetical protein [Candidatus Kaiserbacteria bacterium]
MIFFCAITFPLIVFIIAAPQILWAKANYPKSSKWLLFRLGSSFLGGAISAFALFAQEMSTTTPFINAIVAGTVSMLIVTFLGQFRLKHLFPPQKTVDID